MGKPVGQDPIEIDGIMLRWSDEIPDGMQALYDERSGQVLWVGLIGTSPADGTRGSAVTLSRNDYERVRISANNVALREQIRRFKLN
jgi:hypothetical protein